MKTLVTTLIATSILAGFAVADGAYARRDKPRKKYVAYAPKNADANGYGAATQAQYDINKLPFGSQIWWEQFLRTSGGSGDGGGGSGGNGGQ